MIGLQSIDLGKLLLAGNADPSVGAALHLPIFDAGLRRARFGVNRAQYAAAVADYDDTVINAAQEVATQATNRAHFIAEQRINSQQVTTAAEMMHSAQSQQAQGLIDAKPGLTAAQMVIDQQDLLIQVDLAALSADIALQRALGGGYRNNHEQLSSGISP
jgi:multidrug efflux system outer membrane protein